MKYYTVEARSVDGKRVKIYTGIKTKTAREAMEHVKSITKHDDRWEMRPCLSKHYKDRKWTQGRERHERREQNRSTWSLLAKHASKRRLSSMRSDWKLNYRITMARFVEDWKNN